MQPKISSAFAISVIVILAAFFGWLIWLTGNVEELGKKMIDTDVKQSGLNGISGSNNENKGVACTQEAKLCSDGKTSVGRTGPNCEFAACPGGSGKESSVIDASDWKTYKSNLGFSISFPPDWKSVSPNDESFIDFLSDHDFDGDVINRNGFLLITASSENAIKGDENENFYYPKSESLVIEGNPFDSDYSNCVYEKFLLNETKKYVCKDVDGNERFVLDAKNGTSLFFGSYSKNQTDIISKIVDSVVFEK